MSTLKLVHEIKARTTTEEFVPVEAMDYGVLGERAPFATDCGLESVACCNSTIAPN